MWKLYKLTFPNGKCYVGITRRTVEKRFEQHSFSKYPTGKAIRKYGKRNVMIQILDEGTEHYIKSEEARIVNKDWVNSDKNYNLCTGGQMPPGVSLKGSENPMWKGGVSHSPCKICSKPCRGEVCWDCRLAKNDKTKTLCSVCGKPTSRSEYTIHRKCKKLT